MSKHKQTKRTYNSTRRKEQARQTRLQILESARAMFVERGYDGATLDAIASEAGVAVDTLYAIFGSKRGILSGLIEVSLVGDDEQTPLLEREGPRSVIREKDPLRQINLFANDITTIMGRMAPIFSIMRAAAKTEPDIEKMLREMLDSRLQGMMVFVDALNTNHSLNSGVTREEAAETVWMLTSAEMHNLAMMDLGWSEEKYKKWLAAALVNLLLPHGN
ncbi:MAG: TetR/AcrR family transcriptional regulator [Anaerolineales bacterium]|nr:TetR/AcrR family transcriptional regulator [Anaerolineales bacterium]MCB9111221.1 TetR/AcrR family transcriptional regulator [Anaerolineales bacterium]